MLALHYSIKPTREHNDPLWWVTYLKGIIMIKTMFKKDGQWRKPPQLISGVFFILALIAIALEIRYCIIAKISLVPLIQTLMGSAIVFIGAYDYHKRNKKNENNTISDKL